MSLASLPVPLRPLCPLPVTRVLPSIPLALHFGVPGVPLQRPYPHQPHTQYPSRDTKPKIPHFPVPPFSTFVTFIPALFVCLTSVCMSYPKFNPQLKWKSCRYPGCLRAITSDSLRHSCHFGCSSVEPYGCVALFTKGF